MLVKYMKIFLKKKKEKQATSEYEKQKLVEYRKKYYRIEVEVP